ncbi:MAG: glycerophosphodiester phosphodiesterase [Muribaculaceae bacterium]|nr:glycerophosphodiester phosphodiesterase [Muribaculaceae bacterium]
MKRISLFIAAAALAAASLSAYTPKVVAHRGHWQPEGSAQNSIRALVKADSVGVDAVELDVWIDATGTVWVNHNKDINGVVIETADSATVAREHLSNGEPIPTLRRFLAVASELRPDIVLEVKTHEDSLREDAAVDAAIAMVNAAGLAPRTTYITFSRRAFERMVARSGCPVQFLSAVEPAELKALGGTAADYNIIHFRKHPTWIDDLHALGLGVNVWTVNKPEDLRWCIDQGVDFITTNEPELLIQILQEQQEK